MTYRYILVGRNNRTMPIHSSLLLGALQDLIRRQSRPLHKDSAERVWLQGAVEFVDPVIMTPNDYANDCPALIALD